MKINLNHSIIQISLFLLVNVSLKAQVPNWSWAKSQSPDAASGYAYINAVTTDNFGNVYVTGFFNSDIIFGTDRLVSHGDVDIFLVKYNSSGNVVWAKSAGGSDYDEFISDHGGHNIATDYLGNVYITGIFGSTIVFGNDTLRQSSPNGDIFIAKYDSTGNVFWATSIGGDLVEEGYALTTDVDGNVYVTGSFRSPTISIGSDTLYLASGGASMFVAKYNSSGIPIWARATNVQSNQFSAGYGIVTDYNKNVYVTGEWQGHSISFGTQIATSVLGGSNIYITKLDSTGTFIWVKSAEGNDRVLSTGIVTDIYSNIYITGSFKSSNLVFDNDTLTNGPIYVVKLNSSGTTLWAKSISGDYDDLGLGIAIDNNNDIYITGDFINGVNFDSLTLNSNGSYDMYIAKYNTLGHAIWAINAGGISSDGVSSIATDVNGNLFVAGGFYSPIMNFGVTALNNSNLPSYDIFLAKLGSTTTEINEIEKLNPKVTLFPNPALINLTILLTHPAKNAEVIITDITGQMIYKFTAIEIQRIEVNTKDFAEGIYIVQILTPDFRETKKFIIEKF